MWGLDDYQCLPFLWGSSQLANHPAFTPAAIHKEAILREAAHEYLYLAAIAFIKQVMSGRPESSNPGLQQLSSGIGSAGQERTVGRGVTHAERHQWPGILAQGVPGLQLAVLAALSVPNLTQPVLAQVNSGMAKLYQAEVLSKVPIMQHFLFGCLLPFPAS